MEKDMPKKGRYNNDYSPKFSDPYDIYDKAKEHMRKLRREQTAKKDFTPSEKYFENRSCKYYPCHKNAEIDEQGDAHINCLFCYCPMYHLENCPGNPRFKDKDGSKVKVCTDCTFPHNKDNYDKVMEVLRADKT